eukprot:1058649-Rhodomonas_salina.2
MIVRLLPHILTDHPLCRLSHDSHALPVAAREVYFDSPSKGRGEDTVEKTFLSFAGQGLDAWILDESSCGAVGVVGSGGSNRSGCREREEERVAEGKREAH